MGRHEAAAAALRARLLESLDRHSALPALHDGTSTMSYRELKRFVESWSRRLGADPGPVGLVTIAHPLTYALYLAAVVAGRVVVPISPGWPPEQVSVILEQVGVGRVVRSGSRAEPGWAGGWRAGTTEGVDVFSLGDGPAAGDHPWLYVLHTSGSTGTPKAVPVGAHQLASFLDHMMPRLAIVPGSQLSSTFDLAFDVAVLDLLGAVLNGATMHIPRGAEQATCAAYVRRRGLTHWFSVPSAISSAVLLEQLSPGAMPTLRSSLFAGEQLTWNQIARWRTAAPHSIIENVYGPTELALACSVYRVPADSSAWPRTSNATVPIGRVFPHLESRIGSTRNEHELLIRGPQRFDGYLRSSENASAFEGPAGADLETDRPLPADYWYRTGDRVKVENGELVFHGRVDRQVKINGARVELGEVEFAFLRQGGVQHAAAVVESHSGRSSLAVVLTGDAEDRESAERSARESLPRYMWPRRVCWIDRMPLNGNGKVDHPAVRRLVDATAVAPAPGLSGRPA